MGEKVLPQQLARLNSEKTAANSTIENANSTIENANSTIENAKTNKIELLKLSEEINFGAAVAPETSEY